MFLIPMGHFLIEIPVDQGSSSLTKVWSNLGQTRSTLVKLGQIWSKLSELWEMHPGPCFTGFFGTVDPSRVGNGSVKPRSTSINLGQPWENLVGFWEMCPRPHFEVI